MLGNFQTELQNLDTYYKCPLLGNILSGFSRHSGLPTQSSLRVGGNSTESVTPEAETLLVAGSTAHRVRTERGEREVTVHPVLQGLQRKCASRLGEEEEGREREIRFFAESGNKQNKTRYHCHTSHSGVSRGVQFR